ncbi:MAG: hypothetical protein ABGZ36_21980 [Actinomycetota bacterium]
MASNHEGGTVVPGPPDATDPTPPPTPLPPAPLPSRSTAAALQVYDRHADRLYDFVVAVTRDAGAAAELVRDVVVAARAPGHPTEPHELRMWLYATIRSEAFDWLAARGRLSPEDRVVELPHVRQDHTTGDLGAVVWEALAACSERDQALMTLHLRHGLSGADLAGAMGLSEVASNRLLDRALERAHEEIGALLSLLGVGPAWPGLSQLQEEWDGTYSPWVRRIVTAQQHAQAITGAVPMPPGAPDPLQLLQAVPLAPAPPQLRDAVSTRLEAVDAVAMPSPVADPADLDDTIPPEAAIPFVTRDDDPTIPPEQAVPWPAPDDDATIPPEHAVPLASPPVDLEGATTTGPVGPTSSPSDPPAPATVTVPDGDGAATEPKRHRRVPLVLSVALGAAIALVVAGILARALFGDEVGEPAALTTESVPEVPDRSNPPAIPSTTAAGTPSPSAEGASGAVAAASDGVPTVPEAVDADPSASAPDADRGELLVPADPVVVDDDGGTVQLGNGGAAPLEWQITGGPGWATFEPGSGTIGPGSTVQVGISRVGDMPEGDHEGIVRIETAVGTVREVVVTTAVERPPELQEVQFGTRLLIQQGCGLDSSEVAVTVADESGIDAVVLTVDGPGAGRQSQVDLRPDPTSPGQFVGVVGPFDSPGTAAVTVTATDTRGNESMADGGMLTIAPCPGRSAG